MRVFLFFCAANDVSHPILDRQRGAWPETLGIPQKMALKTYHWRDVKRDGIGYIYFIISVSECATVFLFGAPLFL
jgi:hypothetical protein